MAATATTNNDNNTVIVEPAATSDTPLIALQLILMVR